MTPAFASRDRSTQSAVWALLALATPLILVSISRVLMGFIDFAMVSQLGTAAQAAISPATLALWTFICVGVGIATSVQTFAAQAHGRGEPERGASYAWQAIWLGLSSVLFIVPVTRAVPIVYAWLGTVAKHDPAVLALETQYCSITLWCLVPALMSSGLDGYFSGIQRPRVCVIAVVASLVTNVIGNYGLIWGHFGLPALGIYGAGLATVIGWWARFLVLFVVFVSPAYARAFHTRRGSPLRLRLLRDIVVIGGPTGLSWLADVGAWTVFMNVINPHFGTVAMAATAICLQYTHIAFMPAVGIGQALCTQVGYAIGVRRPEDVALRTRIALFVNMAYMGSIGLLLFALRAPLMQVLSNDPVVVWAGMGIMCWVATYQVFDAMSITYIFALRGAGDTSIPALLNAGCCWIVFIGGGALIAWLAPELGVHGPWALAMSYLTLLGFLLLWRYRSGAWRRIRIFASTDAAILDEKRAAAESIAPTAALDPGLGLDADVAVAPVADGEARAAESVAAG